MTPRDTTIPPELHQSLPRRVRIRRRILYPVFLSSLMNFLIFIPLFFFLIYLPAVKQVALQEHGIDTLGTVTGKIIEHAKNSYHYKVSYTYRAINTQEPVYSDTDKVDATDSAQVEIGQPIPVIYDSQNSGQSSINLHNWVRTRDPYRMFSVFVPIFLGMPIVTTLLFALILYFSSRKETALIKQGTATNATILHQENYNAGKAGVLCKATYSFRDAQGQTIEGERKSLPTEASAAKNAISRLIRDQALKNPTVLYDPQDSRRNILYPGIYVECLPDSNAF